MISMLEITEKKTPLNNKKKGMTLVEVMAAMAILLILFGAISGFLINTVKIEDKSNTLLDNTTTIKAVLMMFEGKGFNGGNQEYYLSNSIFKDKYLGKSVTIFFKDIPDMQGNIILGNNEMNQKDTDKYKVIIKVNGRKISDSSESNNIYIVKATLENLNKINSEITKEIYVDRKL